MRTTIPADDMLLHFSAPFTYRQDVKFVQFKRCDFLLGKKNAIMNVFKQFFSTVSEVYILSRSGFHCITVLVTRGDQRENAVISKQSPLSHDLSSPVLICFLCSISGLEFDQ